MITSWEYVRDRDTLRTSIKRLILDNNYKTIDVGASAFYWSYPECRYSADSCDIIKDNNTHFKLNFESQSEHGILLDYVNRNGKFDFSICSHTLEDIFNPIDLIKLLESISIRGVVMVPSKFDEFSYLFDNKYLGNAHHKQFFDVIDGGLVIFPKFSFIEVSAQTSEIRAKRSERELMFFWESSIPYKVFGNGTPFMCDKDLINAYFYELGKS